MTRAINSFICSETASAESETKIGEKEINTFFNAAGDYLEKHIGDIMYLRLTDNFEFPQEIIDKNNRIMKI